MRVCFFAKAPHRSPLTTLEYYEQDLRILRELGFDVTTATRWSEIPRNMDLYFVWWWQWAFLVVLKNLLNRTPLIATGVVNFQLPLHLDKPGSFHLAEVGEEMADALRPEAGDDEYLHFAG